MAIDLIVEADAAAASERAAAIMADAINADPALSLVVATGNSPMATYARLAELKAQGSTETSRITVFQLDSYIGTPDGDPRSLHGWMERSFLEPLGISPGRVVRFAPAPRDPHEECRSFKERLDRFGGLGLSVLGLGPNGHLGFNEPPSSPQSTTRVVTLTPESIASNAVYWGGEEAVPRQAMTVGLDALLSARQTLLIVTGARKHEILKRTLEGPISPDNPASYLREARNVTVVADRAAWNGSG